MIVCLQHSEPRQCRLTLKKDDSFLNGQVTYTIPRPGTSPSDTVLLGGTFEQGNWDTSLDMNIAQAIFDRCAKLEPSLNDRNRTKILGHHVGLRPARKGGARVEAEVIQFPLRGGNHDLVPFNPSPSEECNTLQVVHAYGFG